MEARLAVAEKKVLDLNLKLESVSMMHILVCDEVSIMEINFFWIGDMGQKFLVKYDHVHVSLLRLIWDR